MPASGLPLFRRNTESGGNPLVFVHGIKGSRLVDGRGKTHWLSAWSAFGLATPDLCLSLRWRDGRQEEDNLTAAEPISTIDIIPGLIRTKFYAPWLKLAEALGRPFYGFAYDWRRDNLENVAKLREAVQAIRTRHGQAQVQLVAHSMGGLVSLPVLTEHPEWFVHAVFAGVPFRGGIGFFEDMHVGLPTGRNRKITSPEMLFTCPSAYTLYPLDRSDCIDAAGNPLEIDFFDAGDWVKNGMGIFADPEMATAERVEHLINALQRAKQLKLLLAHRKQSYPSITVLANQELPTLGTAIRNGPKSVRGWDLSSAPKKPGDSRVCFDRMIPPDGFEYEMVLTSFSHGDMLNDPVMTDILRAGVSQTVGAAS